MKIAVVCPIGDLNRFGYARVAKICLDSWRQVGNLFIICSSRADPPYPIQGQSIRDERTLLEMRDGKEWFDHRVIQNNVMRGMETARAAGYPFAVVVACNWYIERAASRQVLDKCARVTDCDFMYRRTQIGNCLFDSDFRTMSLYNLEVMSSEYAKVIVLGRIEQRGDYGSQNAEAYIDAGLEITDDEMKDKLKDTRNYEDMLPKRHGADWNYWLRYYAARAVCMKKSSDEPGPIGQQIAALHRPDFFGDRLLA